MTHTGSDDTLPPIIDATLKESMRKYPVAPDGSLRMVEDPMGFSFTTLDGKNINIPKGTWVHVPIYALHNYSGNWDAPR